MGLENEEKQEPLFLTGIPGIDAQHKEWFLLCDSLIDSLEKGTISFDLQYSLIQDLLERMKTHFVTEDNLMEMISFPKSAEHKAAHNDFFTRLAKEADAHKSNESSGNGNSGLSGFLRSLLEEIREHIAVFDKELTIHIESLMSLRKKYNITALKAQVLIE